MGLILFTVFFSESISQNEGSPPQNLNECGIWVRNINGGVFTSPNYPNTYPPNKECVYILEGTFLFLPSLFLTHTQTHTSLSWGQNKGCVREWGRQSQHIHTAHIWSVWLKTFVAHSFPVWNVWRCECTATLLYSSLQRHPQHTGRLVEHQLSVLKTWKSYT